MADHLAVYDGGLGVGGRQAACRLLIESLASRSAPTWLHCARELVLRNDRASARQLLQAALTLHAFDAELQFALAGVQIEARNVVAAEALLRHLLSQQPDHAAASFLLAQLLYEQGRYQAMADTLLKQFVQPGRNADQVIQAIELLDDAGRQVDAAAICEGYLATGSNDARIHAYAGMLQIQLGQFDRARESYLHAIAHDARAFEWTIPVGLSSLQRYADGSHPDFALLREGLARPGLDAQAHTSLLFALGKAHDDIGEYAAAAGYLIDANTRVRETHPWSRKHWQRAVQSRLSAKPWPTRQIPATDWTPVFIVGVPRSGTTLIAELLARYPDVRNRGELAALPQLEQRLERASHDDTTLFEQVTMAYQARLLQDDTPARWYIDKEPLNLLRVDLILAMYPRARIIICERNARDTALSLWSQHFSQGANGYAHDLADIAAVIKGCRQLGSHWQARYSASVRTVRYEELIADAPTSISQLAQWLGLAIIEPNGACATPGTTISTGSVWQARQPIYSSSVARWKRYAPYLPGLLRLPND